MNVDNHGSDNHHRFPLAFFPSCRSPNLALYLSGDSALACRSASSKASNLACSSSREMSPDGWGADDEDGLSFSFS